MVVVAAMACVRRLDQKEVSRSAEVTWIEEPEGAKAHRQTCAVQQSLSASHLRSFSSRPCWERYRGELPAGN